MLLVGTERLNLLDALGFGVSGLQTTLFITHKALRGVPRVSSLQQLHAGERSSSTAQDVTHGPTKLGF